MHCQAYLECTLWYYTAPAILSLSWKVSLACNFNLFLFFNFNLFLGCLYIPTQLRVHACWIRSRYRHWHVCTEYFLHMKTSVSTAIIKTISDVMMTLLSHKVVGSTSSAVIFKISKVNQLHIRCDTVYNQSEGITGWIFY